MEWAANAPTPFDADAFAGLADNQSSDAPILQDWDSSVPLEIRFTAEYDDEHGWHGLELDTVELDAAEGDRRSSRLTASESFLAALEEPDEDPS